MRGFLLNSIVIETRAGKLKWVVERLGEKAEETEGQRSSEGGKRGY